MVVMSNDKVNEMLQRSQQFPKSIVSPDYWRELCPWLTVSVDVEEEPSDSPLEQSESEINNRMNQMKRDGFFVLKSDETNIPRNTIELLRRGVSQIVSHGWQATFITVYDEAWIVAKALEPIISSATGGYKIFNHDWLAYHVDASESGMPPHRDFPKCSPESWHDDNMMFPKVATAWIALSDVTSAHSHLYFLPACKDHLYRFVILIYFFCIDF